MTDTSASDQRAAEAATSKHVELAAALSSASVESQAAHACVQAARRTPGVDVAGVYLFDDDTGDLVIVAAHGASAAFAQAVSRFSATEPRVRWLRESAGKGHNFLIVPVRASNDPATRAEGIQGVAVLAFRFHGEVYGCLNVATRDQAFFPQPTRQSLEVIAAMTGEALARLDAERRMRQSEARLRSLFDTMSQGVVYQDRNGKVLQANPAAQRILGLSEDQLLGRVPLPPGWRMTREDGSTVEPRDYPSMRALTTGQPVRNVLAGIETSHDGPPRWIVIDAFPEFDERKSFPTRVHSVFSDVTDQRAANQSLREQQGQYRAMIGAALDGFVVVSTRGRILEANDAYCRMLGYSIEQLSRMTVADVDAETDSAIVAGHIQEVLLHGWSRFEVRHRCSGGGTLDAEVSAWLVPGQDRIIAFVRDLTATKNAARTQAEHEHRYQAILQGAMDGFFATDAAGQLIEVNDALCAMLGYDRSALRTMKLSDLDISDGQTSDAGRISRLRVLHSSRFETVLRSARSEPVEVEISAWMLPGRDAVFGFVRDISARRRAEQELRNSEAQLRQAQKMEAVGRLAGGIAHDFNNILTVISTTTDLALGGLGDTDPLRADLTEIKDAGARAAALTRQLLTFSRRQVIQPRLLDLNTIVGDLQRMLHRLIGEDIETTVLLNSQHPHLVADAGQLEQVVLNLAVNARDAMPDGGVLTIETSSVVFSGDSKLKPASVPPGSFVVLSVSDTGCGMDQDTLSRIFEPFFTTKGLNGTGLGLATVFGIVKQSDGHIVVSSHPGRGTRFDLYFPRVFGQAPVSDEHVPMRLAKGGETILLVEDEGRLQQVVRTVLQSAGYRVLAASNGEEALRLCAGDGIDLALTDLVMPAMSGREFAERAAKVCPRMKILYCSGYSGDVLSRQGALEPGVHFLPKPFDGETLRRKIRAVLDDDVPPER